MRILVFYVLLPPNQKDDPAEVYDSNGTMLACYLILKPLQDGKSYNVDQYEI